jgi:hypothetical protein
MNKINDYEITSHAIKRIKQRFGVEKDFAEEWIKENIPRLHLNKESKQPSLDKEMWSDDNISIVVGNEDKKIITVFPSKKRYEKINYNDVIDVDSINEIISVVNQEYNLFTKSYLKDIKKQTAKLSKINFETADETNDTLNKISNDLNQLISNGEQTKNAFELLINLLNNSANQEENEEKVFSKAVTMYEIIDYLVNYKYLEYSEIAEKMGKSVDSIKAWHQIGNLASPKNISKVISTFEIKVED